MKKIIFLVGLCLSLSFKAAANPKDDELEKIAKGYVENVLSSHPEFATELGDHRLDGVLSDYSPETRARMLATAKQVRDALKKFDDYKQLTGANQVDVRILRDNIDNEIFELEELREPDWNPLVYNQSLANSLYLLVARDFDLPEKRIPNLRKRSDGNFRIGPDKFRKKLRFALASDLSMEEIMKRAQTDLQQTQTAIYETALPLYKKYFPNADKTTLADKHKITAAVLAKLAEQHPDDATVVGYAKEVVSEATNFVRSHNLVTIPDTPLDVIAMPEFKRGVAIAYC